MVQRATSEGAMGTICLEGVEAVARDHWAAIAESRAAFTSPAVVCTLHEFTRAHANTSPCRNAITSSSEAMASKATEQVGLMKELKDDLGDLRRSGHDTKVREMKVAQSIMDGSREAQAML